MGHEQDVATMRITSGPTSSTVGRPIAKCGAEQGDLADEDVLRAQAGEVTERGSL